MKILIVGSGGREHALAWKITQSPLMAAPSSRLWIAPGNGGTAQLGENIPIQVEEVPALVAFARKEQVDLVVVGPEAALAQGLVDDLQAAGIRAFGPSRAAAEIETSKAFAKAFLQRHNIPSARFATFTAYEAALAHLRSVAYPVVLKTSGLAAGKGVFIPETLAEAEAALQAMLCERIFGAAGDTVIIEERLSGEEVSLLAFSDGTHVYPMLPAQDHKRLLDGDSGPNTGGMGAYAPAPACPPELITAVTRDILQPTVDGLRQEGRPFVGVLYAGLMLTPTGPQVLEFNCRFGDPETQVLLPLLQSDLIEILQGCIDGRLDQVTPRWSTGAAATVVLASPGYPGKYPSGTPITGLESAALHSLIFHAGTDRRQGQLLSAGGRVLNITGVGASLPSALDAAYQAIQCIRFEGMQYRRDIGHHALARLAQNPSPSAAAPGLANPGAAIPGAAAPGATSVSNAYAASGVDIEAGNRAVALMKDAVRSTYTPAVLAGIGAFGGLFDASALKDMHNPALVASTDGVGTKVRLAAAAGRYESIGADIVNHCINDILVQGARPLFFLDYFACSHLDPQIVARVVTGISAACRESGCVLLGGETAEMPGVYAPGEFDLAGTIVGVVERQAILPRPDLQPGDLLLGLPSSGPHTNGYSLIRRIFADTPLDTVFPELGRPLADVLLAPHRSYLPVLKPALGLERTPIKALAHLTGGGFIENIPRILPQGLKAVIHTGSWDIPPLYHLIQSMGQVDWREMHRVFNLGIGMVVIVQPDQLETFQRTLAQPAQIIGELAAGEKKVELV